MIKDLLPIVFIRFLQRYNIKSLVPKKMFWFWPIGQILVITTLLKTLEKSRGEWKRNQSFVTNKWKVKEITPHYSRPLSRGSKFPEMEYIRQLSQKCKFYGNILLEKFPKWKQNTLIFPFYFSSYRFISYFCASKCINSIETLKSEMHCNMQY